MQPAGDALAACAIDYCVANMLGDASSGLASNDASLPFGLASVNRGLAWALFLLKERLAASASKHRLTRDFAQSRMQSFAWHSTNEDPRVLQIGIGLVCPRQDFFDFGLEPKETTGIRNRVDISDCLKSGAQASFEPAGNLPQEPEKGRCKWGEQR